MKTNGRGPLLSRKMIRKEGREIKKAEKEKKKKWDLGIGQVGA